MYRLQMSVLSYWGRNGTNPFDLFEIKNHDEVDEYLHSFVGCHSWYMSMNFLFPLIQFAQPLYESIPQPNKIGIKYDVDQDDLTC